MIIHLTQQEMFVLDNLQHVKLPRKYIYIYIYFEWENQLSMTDLALHFSMIKKIAKLYHVFFYRKIE